MFEVVLLVAIVMQEHCKKSRKASAKGEDSWKCTNTHFDNVLNLNDRTFNVIPRRMYLHLCFEDCKTDLECCSHLSDMEAFNCNE
jgi:hypothetical protein